MAGECLDETISKMINITLVMVGGQQRTMDEGLQDPAQGAQPLMGTVMETELDQHPFYPQEPTGHRRAQPGRVSTERGPLG